MLNYTLDHNSWKSMKLKVSKSLRMIIRDIAIIWRTASIIVWANWRRTMKPWRKDWGISVISKTKRIRSTGCLKKLSWITNTSINCCSRIKLLPNLNPQVKSHSLLLILTLWITCSKLFEIKNSSSDRIIIDLCRNKLTTCSIGLRQPEKILTKLKKIRKSIKINYIDFLYIFFYQFFFIFVGLSWGFFKSGNFFGSGFKGERFSGFFY